MAKPKISGAELREIRMRNQWTQAKVANLFGCEAQTVALREKRAAAPNHVGYIMQFLDEYDHVRLHYVTFLSQLGTKERL